MAENQITLKVAEAISQKDVGQGVARLDPNVMDDLGIQESAKEKLQLSLFLHKPILVLELSESMV